MPLQLSSSILFSPVYSPTSLICQPQFLSLSGIFLIIGGLFFCVATTGDIDSYFSYFTDITFISLTFYLLFAALHTLVYAFTGRFPLNRWYRPFQLAYTILFTTIITFPIVVTVVYWSLLASKSTFATTYSTWSNISKHAMNSGFAVFEILFSAVVKQPWSHIIWIIAFLGKPLASGLPPG